MKIQPYRILIGAALALLVGAVGAQGNSDSTYPSNSAPRTTAVPSQPSAAKMSGQSDTRVQAPDQEGSQRHGHKAGHPVRHHAARTTGHSDPMASRGDSAYRQALRQCAQEQDPSQRDSCLDNAIDQFHRNT